MRRRRSSDDLTCEERAYRRARRGYKGRPGVLAWCAGLGIHLAVVALLVI